MSATDPRHRILFKGRFLRRLLPLKALKPWEMARYAMEHTEFYKDLYKGKSPERFEELPVLEKMKIKEISPYKLLSDEFKDTVIYYAETTGSSGGPTPSFLTPKEFNGATLLMHMSPYNPEIMSYLKENRTVINGLTFGFTIAGMSFGDAMVNAGALVANVGSRSTIATPVRIARAIARLTPSIITGTPVDFLCWMRILREDFPDKYPEVLDKLKAFLSTAELAADSRVKQIEKEFNIRHVNTYACVEGFFCLTCPCGEKHILDAYHTELFDHKLNSVGLTGTGRIAFTGLLKKSTPLVRYLLDDLVTIRESKCRFGYRKSIQPHGRWELSVRLAGQTLNVEQFEEEIFKHGLFGDYQCEIHDDRIEVTAEKYSVAEGVEPAMEKGLSERFGVKAVVNLVEFGKLIEYREVRMTKPILKLRDMRSSSTQQVPELL